MVNTNNITINKAVTGSVTITNQHNTFGGIKFEDSSANANVIINNMTVSADTTKAATITGNIVGASGILTIRNSASAVINGDITGGIGAVDITNAGEIKTGKKITGGAGDLTITNTETGSIAAAITGGINTIDTTTGAINKIHTTTITNDGAITGAITGSTGNVEIINNTNGTIQTGAITTGNGELNITNSGIISSNIAGGTGATGTLTIQNQAGGTLSGTIASGAGALNITNAGTISGNMTGSTTRATTIINQSGGSITSTYTAGASTRATSITNETGASYAGTIAASTAAGGDLNITNAGTMTATAAITGGAGKLSINNSGLMSNAVTGGTGAVNIINTGTYDDNYTAAAANPGALTFTNSGTITTGTEIGGGTGSTTFTNNANGAVSGTISTTTGQLSVTNLGNITGSVKLNGALAAGTNTINNSGVINEVLFSAANAGVSINNSGQINRLNFDAAATNSKVILGARYAVTIGNTADYIANGALGITGTKANATIQIKNSESFLVTPGSDFDVGSRYNLAHFVFGAGAGGTLQDEAEANITLSAKHIVSAQNIYNLTVDNNGYMSISVEANRSIGSLGAIQSVANMNAQITRTQNLMDGVFDSIATGELGSFHYPREGNLTTPYDRRSQAQRVSDYQSNSGFPVVLTSTPQPQTQGRDSINRSIEVSKVKNWVGFVTPYFSASSINATGFSASSAMSGGFIGGAARMLNNGILIGAHLGAESQVSGKVGSEMQTQGGSFMIGIHSKIPLAQYNRTNFSVVPFIKIQASGMIAVNSYKLTPIGDKTLEASGVVGGFSASALAGADIPTTFGYFTPEIGLMQQAVRMPGLSYTGFNYAGNNQVINALAVTPLFMQAQLRYTKAIELSSMSLFPNIKAGLRYAVVGTDYTTSIFLPNMNANGTYYATNTIDDLVGLVEVGFGMKFGKSASVNLGYSGEYGAQIMTHNVSLRAGFSF